MNRPLRMRNVIWLLAAVLLASAPATAQPPTPDEATASASLTPPPRVLVLESIELTGATRTTLAVVERYLPLQAGQAIDQASLVTAVDDLRASNLFAAVSFFTKPGAERGHLILVLEVTEHRWDFRWAAGNTDLDGWYLVPAMVALENATGHGNLLDLKFRLGLRHAGLFLDYERPRLSNPDISWAARLSLVTTDRPWFADGIEYRQQVESSGLALVRGRRWGDHWRSEVGLALETIDIADHARAASESADGTIRFDDEIRGDALPGAIRDVVGRDQRAIVHLDLQHDTRSPRLRAGSPVGGRWGRLKLTSVLQGPRSSFGVQLDSRLYREVPGGVLATRLRGALVTNHAPFYDRLYLGGMYTVRGFPTYALSGPGGDTWSAAGSLEYRTRILGDAKGTRLAGLVFVDAGAAGTFDDDAFPGVSVGAGYGVRWRVWWLGWLGADVGFPVTKRPLDQRFQVTASIGWSF